jgi:hypothetical protein
LRQLALTEARNFSGMGRRSNAVEVRTYKPGVTPAAADPFTNPFTTTRSRRPVHNGAIPDDRCPDESIGTWSSSL